MSTRGPADRHLSLSGLDDYLGDSVPIILPISGEPASSLFIDPDLKEMGLRVHVGPDQTLPATNLRYVRTRTTRHHGQLCVEVVVTAPALFRDAYPLLCATADRIQLDGLDPAEALTVSLRRLSDLLKQGDGFSRERELGLFGELLVLLGLIDVVGIGAVDMWRGGSGEEHDFAMPEGNVEVKTTASERRTHWIESLTQLVETPGNRLWLVSHQLTSSVAGKGMTLPDLIQRLRGTVGDGIDRGKVDDGLAGSSWNDAYAEQCTTYWTRRQVTQAYLVADDFPRLTPTALKDARVSRDQVREVKYRIDISDRPPAKELPGALSSALTFGVVG